jgi:hypothetical protein
MEKVWCPICEDWVTPVLWMGMDFPAYLCPGCDETLYTEPHTRFEDEPDEEDTAICSICGGYTDTGRDHRGCREQQAYQDEHPEEA